MNKKIVDYILVRARFDWALSSILCKEMENGWQPLGAPFIDKSLFKKVWVQAMVKYEQW